MSKKTKRQKKLADSRRGYQLKEKFVFNQQSNLPVKEEEKTSPSIEPDTNQSRSIYYYPIHLIRKDLTKTLILCILAISLEAALFLILK